MYRITCALLARLLLRRGRGSPSRAQTVGTNGQPGTWRDWALEGTETHWLLFSLSPWKTDAAKVAFSVFVVLVRLDDLMVDSRQKEEHSTLFHSLLAFYLRLRKSHPA
jgi:hypothetical protein